MHPNQTAAHQLIEQAQAALKAGEVHKARPFAIQAVKTAPELEETWLMLAVLVPPHESVICLEKALAINPQSERAQKGLLWAQKRLQSEQETQAPPLVVVPEKPAEPVAPVSEPESIVHETEIVEVEAPEAAPVDEVSNPPEVEPGLDETQPETAQPASPAPVPAVLEPKTSPRRQPEAAPQPARPPSKTPENQKTISRSRILWLVLLLLVLCLAAIWGITQFNPLPAWLTAGRFSGREHGPSWGSAVLVKSADGQMPIPLPAVELTATLIPTQASTPAETFAVPPTATETAFPTETPSPTVTPLPTATATFTLLPPTLTVTSLPSATPVPTDLPSATPQPQVVLVGEATPTALPTDTAVPVPTQALFPTPKPNVAVNPGTSGGERWIDVDLTNQRLSAYEGNSLVGSFVVSTGTWQYPTVTGQYRVYIKYRYKDMSGPGYYLPNVPYTMFFYQGYAIHGTYWHTNFGTPMSHGCVNLTIPDSEWVYNFSSVGTLVNVHY